MAHPNRLPLCGSRRSSRCSSPEAYFGSIDYVLRVLMAYVVAYGRDDTLFVIVGDHPPVAWVASGDTASFDVPIHVLSRDPALLETTADWGWSPGIWPDAAAPVWLMEDFLARTASGRVQ